MRFAALMKALGLKGHRKPPKRRTYRPMFDTLEERRVLATIYVDDDLVQKPNADFTSIQAAVDAANPGDTIKVSAGFYEESVVVDKELRILGAQDRKDPRPKQASLSKQSIVEAPAGALNVFLLQADTELSGFTIQDANDDGDPLGVVGVNMDGNTSGHFVAYNIIQSVTFGIYLNTDGVERTVVQRNLIRHNNQAGAAAGNGIYGDQGASDVMIVENRFTNQGNSGIILIPTFDSETETLIGTYTNIAITGNLMENGGNAGVILANFSDSIVNFNMVKNHGGSAIYFGGGSTNVSVLNNTIKNVAFSGINLTFDYTGVGNTNFTIASNVITNAGDAGIQLRGESEFITVRKNRIEKCGIGIWMRDVDNSSVIDNRLEKGLGDGILNEIVSTGNFFHKNFAKNNAGFDYHDLSVGAGTAGTANTWTKNKGQDASPPGLIN